eukprot:3675203-Amphidinium_carterae.1
MPATLTMVRRTDRQTDSSEGSPKVLQEPPQTYVMSSGNIRSRWGFVQLLVPVLTDGTLGAVSSGHFG